MTPRDLEHLVEGLTAEERMVFADVLELPYIRRNLPRPTTEEFAIFTHNRLLALTRYCTRTSVSRDIAMNLWNDYL